MPKGVGYPKPRGTNTKPKRAPNPVEQAAKQQKRRTRPNLPQQAGTSQGRRPNR